MAWTATSGPRVRESDPRRQRSVPLRDGRSPSWRRRSCSWAVAWPPAAAASPDAGSRASTSSRGVTKSTINVVFPVVALNSLAGQEGFAQDAEYGEQTKAIKFYVGRINSSGRHQRAEDQAGHHQLRPHQRGPDAVVVQDVDRGLAGRLRRARRDRATGPATISCASPRRGTPRSSASGPRSPTGPTRAPPTCGGPARPGDHPPGGRELGARRGTARRDAGRWRVVAGDRASDQVALKQYLLPDLQSGRRHAPW